MNDFVVPLYATLLFFLLNPGVLVTLPSVRSSPAVATLTHSIVFFLLLYLTYAFVYRMFNHYPTHPSLTSTTTMT
jgi:hypothetical protein